MLLRLKRVASYLSGDRYELPSARSSGGDPKFVGWGAYYNKFDGAVWER